MKSRKITKEETKRVIGYCEFVTLFIAAIIVNVKLALVLLALTPIIIPIIVGIKDKNYHILQEDNCTTKDIVTT